jgi:uncharacterized protein (TIGR03084 family)
MTIFDDLQAELDRLDTILAGLDDAQWSSPSAAAGWSVADTVLHLAQSEEGVLSSAAGSILRSTLPGGDGVDDIMGRFVEAERDDPAQIFQRWRAARAAALAALRAADPKQQMSWINTPLRPATLATTRLAEHWAHGLDITGPLGIPFPDTSRLRHIAWLAHRTLPYAFGLTGQPAAEVYCDLTAPGGGERWQYGPRGADSVVTGTAAAFCRVAARRLRPEESGLQATGPHGDAALRVLRTYAA